MTFNVETFANDEQKQIRLQLAELLRASNLPNEELIKNLSLFIPWQETMRCMFIEELYRKQLEVPGVIMEFGNRWGRNLTLFSTLRASLEPFNHNRKIVGFDTFKGLTAPAEKDGNSGFAQEGALATSAGHKQVLEQLLALHEKGLPYAHVKKFELVEGDASVELKKYLAANPEVVVSLVYFDMDLYEPTKNCLELLQPCLTQGSVVAFDEINHRSFPGETIALKEVVGLKNVALKRSPLNPLAAYYVQN